MKKLKLSEANKQASKLIEKLVSNEIKKLRSRESNLSDEEVNMLFIIRDGHGNSILDPWELENYDNSYGIDIYN